MKSETFDVKFPSHSSCLQETLHEDICSRPGLAANVQTLRTPPMSYPAKGLSSGAGRTATLAHIPDPSTLPTRMSAVKCAKDILGSFVLHGSPSSSSAVSHSSRYISGALSGQELFHRWRGRKAIYRCNDGYCGASYNSNSLPFATHSKHKGYLSICPRVLHTNKRSQVDQHQHIFPAIYRGNFIKFSMILLGMLAEGVFLLSRWERSTPTAVACTLGFV